MLKGLAAPIVADGRYLFAETAPDTYANPRWATDHPSVVAMFGVLPGAGVDREVMARTVDWIQAHWDWPSTWGWDYPMVAMTAARLGRPGMAVDALLMDTPKNVYRANGHNHQRPGLTIYLPGNGGLLYAAAMMAAGWDGAPDRTRARLSARRTMGGEVGRVEKGAVEERATMIRKAFRMRVNEGAAEEIRTPPPADLGGTRRRALRPRRAHVLDLHRSGDRRPVRLRRD